MPHSVVQNEYYRQVKRRTLIEKDQELACTKVINKIQNNDSPEVLAECLELLGEAGLTLKHSMDYIGRQLTKKFREDSKFNKGKSPQQGE